MFHPDDGHVHHRLIRMGFWALKAVWLIYLITFGLCTFAMIMVNIQDEPRGIISHCFRCRGRDFCS